MAERYFFTENLCVGYDRKPLIRQMEFSLQKGEILTLIGPNGAGKTTVLKSIAGQLRPVAGTAWLGGEELTGMTGRGRAKKLSIVLTRPLHARMKTCRDVVATGRYPYTGWLGALSARDRQIVEEAMELVRVEELADREFDRISDGQKQRVMLARALCQEPEIVLLDEPTSYLDIRYKLEFLSVLRHLKERRKLTVILSLHELELAKLISDRILCLKGEYVERFGTPEEVFTPGFLERLFDLDESVLPEDARMRDYIRRMGSLAP